ncbi:MAG: hypothetical protein CMF62_10630 [Magnetococcales bacterium]|nr:hypothetical protein [Magnetococcales bacterium]|tara:strand:+ start:162201 stop:162443 length:243 start_codon:yes stop_codon:yes gene_type:complete
MKPDNERRITPPTPDKELYGYPNKTIENFIEKERRHDELDRLREIRQQRSTWFWTIGFCLLLNLLFVALAAYGWMTNGFS